MNHAANAMLAHRYGQTAPTAAPTATATATPLSRAGSELNQWLKASQVAFIGQLIKGPGLPPAYAFRFKLPLDHVIQQLGPQVLTIAARHQIPVTLLSVYKEGPEAVIVLGSGDTAKLAFR